jgi:hypothetical protein
MRSFRSDRGVTWPSRFPAPGTLRFPATDHLVLDNETQDVIADEIEEFITGTRRHLEPDWVLATVMFTDIVRSTERAAQLGDARWCELLSNYFAVLRKELTAFRGREVNTAGDGLLASCATSATYVPPFQRGRWERRHHAKPGPRHRPTQPPSPTC